MSIMSPIYGLRLWPWENRNDHRDAEAGTDPLLKPPPFEELSRTVLMNLKVIRGCARIVWLDEHWNVGSIVWHGGSVIIVRIIEPVFRTSVNPGDWNTIAEGDSAILLSRSG
jgi:hypothetical protein